MSERTPNPDNHNSPAYESGRRFVQALQFARVVADVPTSRRGFLINSFIDPIRRAMGKGPGVEGERSNPNQGRKK